MPHCVHSYTHTPSSRWHPYIVDEHLEAIVHRQIIYDWLMTEKRWPACIFMRAHICGHSVIFWLSATLPTVMAVSERSKACRRNTGWQSHASNVKRKNTLYVGCGGSGLRTNWIWQTCLNTSRKWKSGETRDFLILADTQNSMKKAWERQKHKVHV